MRRVVPALALVLAAVAVPAAGAADCTRTSVGLTPLSDLTGGEYRGEEGGLYPGRTNAPPPAHAAAGLALADGIGPMNAGGAPDPAGRYVLLSIGMSNTTQEFSTFKPIADADPSKDPRLVIVDGAQGGVTASRWANPNDSAWSTVDQRLAGAGVTREQVAVVWIKVANAGPTSGWPAATQTLEGHMETIVGLLKDRFPNLGLAYNSSRIYAGYASTNLNPEPYAYESGFAVKWLIRRQLEGVASLNFDPARGAVEAPWLAWGPYLWADGLAGRSDGLTWQCSDFGSDGTHPSASGRQKVAGLLLDFFKTDPTAVRWFVRLPVSVEDVAGDANALNGQGLVGGQESGANTRPASVDGADLVHARFETAFESVPVGEDGIDHRATGVVVRFGTLGVPKADGPTLAYRLALDIGGCASVLEAFLRGPASGSLDPPDRQVRWRQLQPSCPDGVASVAKPAWQASVESGPRELVLRFAHETLTARQLAVLSEGSALRSPRAATLATFGDATAPQIDETPVGREFVVGSDMPPDVPCTRGCP